MAMNPEPGSPHHGGGASASSSALRLMRMLPSLTSPPAPQRVAGRSRSLAESTRRGWLTLPGGLVTRARSWLAAKLRGAELGADDEARFQAESLARNRRNVVTAVLALLPLHLLAALLYWPAGGPFTQLPSPMATACVINLAAMPAAGLLAVLVHWFEPRCSRGRWRGWGGPLFALLYVVLAAALAVNAQRIHGSTTAYIFSLLGLTLLLRLSVQVLALVLGVGLVALVAGELWVVPEHDLRMMALSSGVAFTVLAFVMARILTASARVELAGRLVIERQGAELRALNDELEDRVLAQVDEIIARAQEIKKLNRHLRRQVVDRSRQLAQALRSLEPAAVAPLEVGALIDGRIEIRGLLGSGAMGEVYRGQDRILERAVAVKVLRPDSGVSSEVWVRFAAEAEAAAAVQHPCVVPTLHVGITEAGRLYQLQDLVEGVTLAATLAEGERWPALAAARLGARLAEALAAAHDVGVVHRDVKPSNVMISTQAPGLHLLDFGVARSLEGRRAGASGPTVMLGTPVYMSPEQITAPDTVAPPADVYALGVLLYELIKGKPPFMGDMRSVLHLHVHQPAPALPATLAPAALAELVARCLAKQPAARPTAQEVAAQLAELADGAGVPPVEALARPRRPASALDSRDTVRLDASR
ncbi:MAG: serine/threonine protein kinase [Deltaproteobacteria bacterium]|nr:serine/threonine protein kinase [Deltaproteobacteria bacterium]